ncbi:MAG: hypothetical protein IPJ32_08190 [Sphingobacteriaceae bacterium]|nr:hypothetical protein [Sphingobacteriaceae bacterium]
MSKTCDILWHKCSEVALVNVIEGSFKPGDLSKNTRYFRSGVIAFGSKVIENNTMLSKLDTIPDKTTFKKYSNPVDIIKIILFDLHMGNADRQEENFNILIKETIPSNLFVIDHFYCFGGATKIGVFTPAIGVYPDATDY